MGVEMSSRPAKADLKADCPEKERLLREYGKAAAVYSQAVRHLSDSLGVVPSDDYEALRVSVEDARQACEAARIEFDNHLRDHRC